MELTETGKSVVLFHDHFCLLNFKCVAVIVTHSVYIFVDCIIRLNTFINCQLSSGDVSVFFSEFTAPQAICCILL